MKNILQSNKIVAFFCLVTGLATAQIPAGYEPAPSTSALSTNGNFANMGGSATISGVVNAPATTAGQYNAAVGIYSQAKFNPNQIYEDNSNYNTYTIMSGSKSLNVPFTGALLNTFPGDPAKNVAPATNYLYSNGNVFPNLEYVIWGQTLTNLVVNRYYSFSMYVNNAIEPPAGAPDDPVVRLKVGGNVALPNGTTVAGPTTLTEAATASTQPLGGWQRVEYTFQATSTTQVFKVTSSASGTWGDDFQMTQVQIVEFRPIITSSTSTPQCLGKSLTLYATTPASGTFSYSWTGPNGFTSNQQNPVIPNLTAANAGTYTVSITDQGGATNTSSVTVTPAPDFDGDGISDPCDLDDDNDGILDAIEGRCATEAFEGFDSPLNNNITNGAGQNRGTTFNGWTTQNGTNIMTIRVNGTNYTPGPNSAQSGTQYIDMNNAGDYMYKTVTFATPVVINASAYFNNRDTQANNYVPWTGFIQITSDTSTSPTFLAAGNNVNFVKAEGNDGPWKQSSINNVSLSAGTYRIRVYISDFGHMDTIYYCASTDTDGDGTPDYLDADSDGDGCFDAVEGGDNVTASMLNTQGRITVAANGTGTTVVVDTNGVPQVVNSGGAAETGTIEQGQPVGNSQNQLAVDCAVPFTCNSNMYIVQGIPAILYRIDTTTNPFTFTQIGSGATVGLNGVGYNTSDNFIYGLNGGSGVAKTLYKIDSAGNFYNLGVVSGLGTGGGTTSGEFDTAGNYYVKLAGSSNILYKVNVTDKSVTQITLSQSVGFVDLAYTANDNMLWSIDQATNKLVSISLATGTLGQVTSTPFTHTYNQYGAWFGSSTGAIYASANNGTNGFVQFDKVTGNPTVISATQASANNDGAHCNTVAISFGSDLSITKTDGVTQYTAGSSVTYTIVAKNNGVYGVVNAVVTDALPTGIPAANMSYYAVASTGSSTNVTGTSTSPQTGAINDLVDLPVNGTVTYTVTINIPTTYTGNLVNTATIAVPTDGSTTDPTPGNNTATDTDTASACYNDPFTGAAGVDTKHGITLLQRAGNDGDGDATNDWPMIRKSAHTVLESNTKGFVISRMSSAQITAISTPVEGMMVYDTTVKCLKLYDGTQWSCFNTSACP